MQHVHILGVCGTFMGGVAAIAKEAGYRVTGSDRNIYPPMSDQLARLGVELIEGYDAAQLDPAPDVVVVGNVMTRGMPVIEELLNRRIPYMSGPEWLTSAVLRNRSVIGISGTHGKTTTTSLVAWILECAGRQAGFLIGGVPADFEFSARLGTDPVFVIEADEYDTAFFDKRAKFLLYRPQTLVISNLEFDHADIYPDLEAITRQFHQLVRAIPANGRLIVPAGDANVAALLQRGCWTPQDTFASRSGQDNAEWTGLEDPAGTLQIHHQGKEIGRCQWQLSGAHNAENAVAALLATRAVGVPPAVALDAIARFKGVQRRLQRLGEFGGVQVFDDFAHHPTAIRRTLEGIRRRADVQRVIAVFEPRSNSMKLGVYQGALSPALSAADEAWVLRPTGLKWDLDAEFRDDPGVSLCLDIESIVSGVVAAARPGDAVVVMSNGDFQGIHGTLSKALGSRR
ncbi:MAG: UDP-N-acetylmuramate:L-alanyl-gamma-D-glutamyl-meso-diaminopimelate ligase [Chromatiales bacterium]|jgi:UDP-N-acetylmuramate: L-alanyl-gamma-D-glutamyl-meso-diaminopimelate ligase|nr:MAG: UDP-N-acetylmuramate:L-alanyl-gamma-D-glutamyl-meso-diaminopimelate ligase [Chromatiales bacterium]